MLKSETLATWSPPQQQQDLSPVDRLLEAGKNTPCSIPMSARKNAAGNVKRGFVPFDCKSMPLQKINHTSQFQSYKLWLGSAEKDLRNRA